MQIKFCKSKCPDIGICLVTRIFTLCTLGKFPGSCNVKTFCCIFLGTLGINLFLDINFLRFLKIS